MIIVYLLLFETYSHYPSDYVEASKLNSVVKQEVALFRLQRTELLSQLRLLPVLQF